VYTLFWTTLYFDTHNRQSPNSPWLQTSHNVVRILPNLKFLYHIIFDKVRGLYLDMILHLLRFIYSRPRRMSIYGRPKMIGEEWQDSTYVEHGPCRTHWRWDLLVCVYYVGLPVSVSYQRGLYNPCFHHYSCSVVRVIGVLHAHSGRVPTPLGLPTHMPRDRCSCLRFQTDYFRTIICHVIQQQIITIPLWAEGAVEFEMPTGPRAMTSS
jgi:hypothetical protein